MKTLALLSKFVIADMTDPHFSPYELSSIVELAIPIQPLIQAPRRGTFTDNGATS
ncbi:MAG: hypothetical protein ACXV7G_10995 [Halobacteriota archaeon]